MNSVPQHIAIIMDGNGRWAQEQGLPRMDGHKRGMDVADDIVTAARERGIPFVTLYAFSDENWERPAEEVAGLMDLLADFLVNRRERMVENGVRLRTIGDVSRLPDSVQSLLDETKAATAHCDQTTLVLALSYGSRAEICRAIARAQAAGIDEITPEVMSQHLDTADFPDPDLLIRTSGEYRISNYLLWQLSYAELYFTETHWPDFTPTHLEHALADYAGRERRFGRVGKSCYEHAS